MKIKKTFDADILIEQLIGNTCQQGVVSLRSSQLRALSQCITWVENDPFSAQILLQHPKLLSRPNASRVVGITGMPGAGKSTLTEGLISTIRKNNLSVAVLAVDPSSQKTGGAFLGDRVRMQSHFSDEGVYIRSMGSRGTLGGVARATRTAVRLLGYMGFDIILIETVGIGQSESEITQIADTTVLVLMPQSGDEIQLMKAGILESAHIYVVNKSDLHDPLRMMNEIEENTAHVPPGAWQPTILKSSAILNKGVASIYDAIELHGRHLATHPVGQIDRLRSAVKAELQFLIEPYLIKKVTEIEESQLLELQNGKVSTMKLALELLDDKLLRGDKK